MAYPPHSDSGSHSAAESVAYRLERDVAFLADPSSGQVRPSRQLCTALRCSHGTLCSALRLLSERGLLTKATTSRSRWKLTSSESGSSSTLRPPIPFPEKRSRSGAIAEALRDRIVRSRFPLKKLPPGKVLMKEFGCHHGTLRHALELLGSQGLLQCAGGRFSIAHHASANGAAPAVWLPEGTPYFAKLTQWERQAIAGLEQALTDFGWGQLRLLVRELSERDSVRVNRKAAGYVNLYREGRGSWWNMLERAALQYGVPSVLIDLTDVARREQHLRADRRICWIKTDNLEAGRSVGIYLQGKGHQRIAYLSAYPIHEIGTYPLYRPWMHPLWARKRYLGLSETFPVSRAGNLEVFDATDHLGFARVIEARESLLPPAVGRLRERMLPDPWLDPAEVEEAFEPLQRLLESVQDGVALEPWLEGVLNASKATAWVCSNDRLAFLALRFLKQRGRRVPEDIAVVGFDNTLEASRLGLTSFDLGMREIGALAVSLLADPRHVQLDHENTAYVSGRLIPRESG